MCSAILLWLSCICPRANDVHLFKCLFAISKSLVKYLQIYCPFLRGGDFCFLWVLKVLYIFWIKLKYILCKDFSQSEICLFIFLVVSSEKYKVFIWWRNIYLYFHIRTCLSKVMHFILLVSPLLQEFYTFTLYT